MPLRIVSGFDAQVIGLQVCAKSFPKNWVWMRNHDY